MPRLERFLKHKDGLIKNKIIYLIGCYTYTNERRLHSPNKGGYLSYLTYKAF